MTANKRCQGEMNEDDRWTERGSGHTESREIKRRGAAGDITRLVND